MQVTRSNFSVKYIPKPAVYKNLPHIVAWFGSELSKISNSVVSNGSLG
jgi:hypothetical protein